MKRVFYIIVWRTVDDLRALNHGQKVAHIATQPVECSVQCEQQLTSLKALEGIGFEVKAYTQVTNHIVMEGFSSAVVPIVFE